MSKCINEASVMTWGSHAVREKKNMLLLVQFYIILRDVKVLYFKAAVCGCQYS